MQQENIWLAGCCQRHVVATTNEYEILACTWKKKHVLVTRYFPLGQIDATKILEKWKQLPNVASILPVLQVNNFVNLEQQHCITMVHATNMTSLHDYLKHDRYVPCPMQAVQYCLQLLRSLQQCCHEKLVIFKELTAEHVFVHQGDIFLAPPMLLENSAFPTKRVATILTSIHRGLNPDDSLLKSFIDKVRQSKIGLHKAIAELEKLKTSASKFKFRICINGNESCSHVVYRKLFVLYEHKADEIVQGQAIYIARDSINALKRCIVLMQKVDPTQFTSLVASQIEQLLSKASSRANEYKLAKSIYTQIKHLLWQYEHLLDERLLTSLHNIHATCRAFYGPSKNDFVDCTHRGYYSSITLNTINQRNLNLGFEQGTELLNTMNSKYDLVVYTLNACNFFRTIENISAFYNEVSIFRTAMLTCTHSRPIFLIICNLNLCFKTLFHQKHKYADLSRTQFFCN